MASVASVTRIYGEVVERVVMNRCLAFVLSGGGARGALQVGALRALLEAGIKPDLLVGTSIGAMNAAALALWGVDLAGVDALEQAWQDVAESHLMDSRISRLLRHRNLSRLNRRASYKVTEFLVAHGLTPDLRFEQITGVRLALIGADLYSGQPVIYGQDPRESILEGILASIALPPWFAPIKRGHQWIVDGGLLSNLPIEPALSLGATAIIALDLQDPDHPPDPDNGSDQLTAWVGFALGRRHTALETALAEARGVPVHRIELKSPVDTSMWDFSNYRWLISAGYAIASQAIPTCVATAQVARVSQG